MTLEVLDYVGDPTKRCEEHQVYYYLICLKCYELKHGREMHQTPGREAPLVKKKRRK